MFGKFFTGVNSINGYIYSRKVYITLGVRIVGRCQDVTNSNR
jgi:hypothetical protein